MLLAWRHAKINLLCHVLCMRRAVCVAAFIASRLKGITEISLGFGTVKNSILSTNISNVSIRECYEYYTPVV